MSHYPPNNGQPPNWQQPWGVPPGQPGEQSFYNQPTQGWQPGQMPLPPIQQPPRRRTLQQRFNALSRKGKISLGCATIFVILSLCICSAAAAANGNTNQQSASPTTIVAVPSDTPTSVMQTVLPTDTPTIAPTDTPVPTPTATATPTPRPTAAPTQPIQRPTPTPTPAPHCVAVNNNPWCYNFTPGNLITNPPSAFCSYFTCVSTFWTANHGYVAECANGSYTHSGGVSGACSRDGGVSQILYSH